jgi:hypothetical protein
LIAYLARLHADIAYLIGTFTPIAYFSIALASITGHVIALAGNLAPGHAYIAGLICAFTPLTCLYFTLAGGFTGVCPCYNRFLFYLITLFELAF